MKLLLTLLFLASAAFVAVGQAPSEPRVTHNYDKFENKTTIRTGFTRAEMTGQFSILITSMDITGAIIKSERLKEPMIMFTFISHSRDWQFLRVRSLIILADAERITFGEGTRSSSVSRGNVREMLSWELTPRQLNVLARAKSVESGRTRGSLVSRTMPISRRWQPHSQRHRSTTFDDDSRNFS